MDTQTDASHCGACGKACTVSGATCEMGACACPGGGTECAGVCVDTLTNASHCGGCGKGCTLTGATCKSGTCGCPGAEVECAGACVDTQTDPLNCGTCGHDCLGGACQGGLCQPVVLASGQSSATAIAVNATSVFWTNYGASGAVMKVPIGGGTPTTLASGQENAAYIAIDDTSVYWTTSHQIVTTKSGTVNKMPISGGTVTTLGTCATSIPTGLAIDATSVYWLCYEGRINKVAKAGGTTTTLTSAVATPMKLVVSGTSLLFTDGGSGLYRISTIGGAITHVAQYIGATSPTGDLVVSGSNAYWTFGATVLTVPLVGGTTTVLADIAGTPSPLAVDSTHAYWSANEIKRVAVTGGTAVTISTGAAAGIALDATHLFLAQGDVVNRLAK